jgi:hypothetical protein
MLMEIEMDDMISEASAVTVAGYDSLEAPRISQRSVRKRCVCALTYHIPRLTVEYKARPYIMLLVSV